MKKLIFIVILLSIAYFSVMAYYKHSINKNGTSEDVVVLEIMPGEGVKSISKKLLDKGLIASGLFFETYVWETESAAKLKAGVYEIKKNSSIVEIAGKLISGEVADRETSIKILEGWTIKEIDKYLSEIHIVEEGEFARKARQTLVDWDFPFAKHSFFEGAPAGVDLEGYLFPDTYRVFVDASVDDIIKRMLDNFDRKMTAELRSEIEKQGKSIHEVVTLASIIEKEVFGEEDMAIVSGILQKRMRVGMRLEVDSSVNYATGKSEPSASLADLQVESLYNTYKHHGLPPGPISNPGFKAIRASVYDKESPYFFYLNRQDTGETIFSIDFEEHVRNKHKYLK